MSNKDMARVVLQMEAEVGKLRRDFDKAEGIVTGSTRKMEAATRKSARGMETTMSAAASKISASFATGLGGALAGLSVGAIVSGVSQIAKGVAEVGDAARVAGIGVQDFQRLKFVAEQNRIGVDSLTDGIKELNLRADEFITTGQGSAADAFKRLGYNSTDLAEKLKDPSALFSEIIGKLGQFEKSAQIRIADEIFGGTGGEKFVQLIEQGEAGIRATIKAADDLGIVMDEELIKKAAEIDRQFGLITTTVGMNLKAAIVEAASELSAFIDSFRAFENQRKSTLTTKQADLGMRRVELEAERSQIQNGDGGWLMNPNGPLGKGRIHEIELELARIAAEERKIVEELNKRVQSIPSATPTAANPIPFSQLPADDINRRVQLAAARESIAKIESAGSGGYSAVGPVTESGDRAYGRYQVMGANIADWSKEALGTPLTIEQFLNNPQLQDKIFDHVFAGYVDKFGMEGASQAWFGGPGAVGKTGRQDQLGTSVGQYGSRFMSGMGNTDAWAGLRDVTAGTVDQTAALTAEYENLGQVATSTLNSIASALSDGKLEGRELVQIMIDLAQQILTMPMGGGKGNLLSTILGGLGGGSKDPWAGMRIPGRAMGGPVAKGQPYIVGEKRAELFVPSTAGRIIPRIEAPTLRPRQAASNTAAGSNILNVTINGASGDPHVRELVRQGVGEALAGQNEKMRRGGYGEMQARYTSQRG